MALSNPNHDPTPTSTPTPTLTPTPNPNPNPNQLREADQLVGLIVDIFTCSVGGCMGAQVC